MDPRRAAARAVIDPKVRQVGFVTSSSSTIEPTVSADPVSQPAGEIPALHPTLSPVMIIPPPRHVQTAAVLIGTNDADHPIGKASSLPASHGEFMAAGVRSTQPAGSVLATAAPLESKASKTEVQNEETPDTRTLKQKTTKAERRAIQDAQRAAKGFKEAGTSRPNQAKANKPVKSSTMMSDEPQVDKKAGDRPLEKDRKKDAPPPRIQFDDKHRVEKAKRRSVVNQSETRNRVELFRHLPQYVHGALLPDLESRFFNLDSIHPSVCKVGLQYLLGEISGGNARCIAMLLAFQEAIKDYSTPPEKVLSRDLTAKIGSYVSFLSDCRPLSISMGNAIRFLKSRIAKLDHNISESEAKSSLVSHIDRFINEKIVIADNVIIRHAATKIRDGDVLLTNGSSSLVEMIFLYAHKLGKQFRVVILDSRPKLEGQQLLRRLLQKGINCTYAHMNAVSHIMHESTRVLLGASSVLSNGTVYARVGTACIAMVAHALHVPVLICCEAYKFHERVQLDSICFNELGDPTLVAKVPRGDANHLSTMVDNENLQLLNLTYDATPSEYVSMIITEYGMIPPTSVPVILREYGREHLWM